VGTTSESGTKTMTTESDPTPTLPRTVLQLMVQSLLGALPVITLVLVVLVGYGLWAEHRLNRWYDTHPTKISPLLVPSLIFDDDGNFVGVFLGLSFLALSGLDDSLRKRERRRLITGQPGPAVIPYVFTSLGVAGVSAGILVGVMGIENAIWSRHALPLRRQAAQERFASETANLKSIFKTPEHYKEETNHWNSTVFQEVHQLENRASRASLIIWVLVAIMMATSGAAVVKKARGERDGPAYKTKEELEAARNWARIEEDVANARKTTQIPSRVGFMVITAVVVVISILFIYYGPFSR